MSCSLRPTQCKVKSTGKVSNLQELLKSGKRETPYLVSSTETKTRTTYVAMGISGISRTQRVGMAASSAPLAALRARATTVSPTYGTTSGRCSGSASLRERSSTSSTSPPVHERCAHVSHAGLAVCKLRPCSDG